MAHGRDPALLTRRHRTVGRIAAILEAAAAGGGVRLSTLVTMLDAPKSSIHALLKGLVSVGYLAETDRGYSLGPAIQVLLGSAERPRLEEVAAGTMRDLRDQVGETVLLGHRVGDSIVYLSAVESHQLIKYAAPLNTRRPLLPTSMGKLYLAELGPADLDAYLGERVPNARRRKKLTSQLAEVAATGVAINQDETVPGVTGVSAGIRESGELVACIGIAGPSDRLGAQLKKLTRAVRTAADRVTAQLP